MRMYLYLKEFVSSDDVWARWLMPKEYSERIINRNFQSMRVILDIMLLWSGLNVVAMHLLAIYGTKKIFYRARLKYFLIYLVIAVLMVFIWYLLQYGKIQTLRVKSCYMYSILLVGVVMSIYAFKSYSLLYGFITYAAVCMTCLLFFVVSPLPFLFLGVIPILHMVAINWRSGAVAIAINMIIMGVLMEALCLYHLVSSVNAYRRQDELLKAAEAAKAADDAKSSFLANMSHEIRTPINAIIGMDEMILREDVSDAVAVYALNIQSASQNLLSTVNDILDFSKIESGKMDIVENDYDLGSVLNDCFNLLYYRAEGKKLRLYVVNNPRLPSMLHGDEVHLRQVITNIMTNAVKYTEYGFIELNVDYEWIDDGHTQINLIISVNDSGIGISDEDIELLYESFQRVNLKKNRTTEGTGLGLAIVKELVELMGGRIEVNSKYMLGSRFTITVPQKVISAERMGDFYQTALRRSAEYKTYKPSFCAPTARILITDDIQMNLDVASGLLKQTEVVVDTALSGFEALDKASETDYDIIFLDHLMPEMDGVETFKRLKEQLGENSTTPIVAMTANAVSGIKKYYLEEGFTNYISKPIDAMRFEKLILQYLPKDKVQILSTKEEESKEYELDDANLPDEPVIKADGDPMIEKLLQMDVITVKEGVYASGSMELYKNVVKQFYDTSQAKISLIESCYQKEDWNTFRIESHALKSSARLLGALRLSAVAAKVEAFAKASDLDSIHKLTPIMLEDYREIRKGLSELFTRDTSNLPEIPREQLKEALQMISDFTKKYDFDTVDSVMRRLAKYRMPEGFDEKLEMIQNYIAEVNGEALVPFVEEMMEEL